MQYQDAEVIQPSEDAGQLLSLVLAFVPAILGISYPLIIQTIGRLADLYKSTNVIDRFRSEYWSIALRYSLILSAVLSIASLVYQWILPFAFVSIIMLLVIFFFNMRLLEIYQSSRKLFNHFMKGFSIPEPFEKVLPRSDMDSVLKSIDEQRPAILDLLLYAIQTNDRELQYQIRVKFFVPIFSFVKYHDQRGNETIEFHQSYYLSIYDILASYVENKDERYYQNFESYIGLIFLSENTEDLSVGYSSKNTFAAIWRNLVLLIENDQDDKIIRYWEQMFQHYSYRFVYSSMKSGARDDEEVLKLNRSHGRDFHQFHTALGAYLMYKEKYKTLKRIWNFSQSSSPSYELLPYSMTEIFKLYFFFLEGYMFDTGFTIGYWFKDLGFDSINNKGDVKTIIRRYLAVLFLKQWITENYYGASRLRFPEIPDDQEEKKSWARHMDFFKILVQRTLDNKDLCAGLGLDSITEDDCKRRSIMHPIAYIDEFKKQLEKGFADALANFELDATMKSAVDEYAVQSINSAYDDVKRVGGNDVDEKDIHDIGLSHKYIRGVRTLLDKETMVANQSTSYVGFDTFIGGMANSQYYEHVSIKFHSIASVYYDTPSGKLFDAIDKLSLNPQEHVVVTFTANPDYLKEYENTVTEAATGSEDFRYKGVPFYCLEKATQVAYGVLYILRITDLPMIKHFDLKDLPTNTERENTRLGQMEIIDQTLKIYREFKALAKDPDRLRQYSYLGEAEEELKKKIEVDVDFIATCWFNKDAKVIALNESESFEDEGTNFAEIKTFNELFPL